MDQKCIESGYAYSSGNQIALFEKCVVKICQPSVSLLTMLEKYS